MPTMLRCKQCHHVWLYRGVSEQSGTSCPKCKGYVSFTRDRVLGEFTPNVAAVAAVKRTKSGAERVLAPAHFCNAEHLKRFLGDGGWKSAKN